MEVGVANKPGYFSKYYEENKGEINDKRKRRYEEDPDYKDRVLQSSRDYRKRKREESGEPKMKLPRYARPMTVGTGDGGEIDLFSIGAFAKLLGRNVQTINHWERALVLPPTPYRDDRGFRFYTIEMMRSVKNAVSHKRRLFPVDEGIRKTIESDWKDQGVPLKATTMKGALKRTTGGGGDDAGV